MTPTIIQEWVDGEALISPRWVAWRKARDRFGYRPTYHAYLRSPEWKAFRDRVRKANPICQACLVEEASEVHHLSYKYVFFENAGMVQCVCRSCHEAMTGIDNYDKRTNNSVSNL